jgi:hypothetical protein
MKPQLYILLPLAKLEKIITTDDFEKCIINTSGEGLSYFIPLDIYQTKILWRDFVEVGGEKFYTGEFARCSSPYGLISGTIKCFSKGEKYADVYFEEHPNLSPIRIDGLIKHPAYEYQ